MKHTRIHVAFALIALGLCLVGIIASFASFEEGLGLMLLGVGLYLDVLWSGRYGRK